MDSDRDLAGSLLWLARNSAGMTQQQVADAAGVPQSTVSAYERGERQPTLPVLFKLIRATGQDLRLRVTAPDVQSVATGQWERSRSQAEQDEWQAEQRVRTRSA